VEVSNGDSKSGAGFTRPLPAARKITGWYIATAVLFIVLGMFAIIEPSVAGLGVTLLVGWLLIFGGVTHLIGAFKGAAGSRSSFKCWPGLHT
jgi:uncharacterized membrane protein HdeD (DUF308 family)